MDIRTSIATQAYSTAQQIAKPTTAEASGRTAGEVFSDVAGGFENLLRKSEEVSKQSMTTGVDPHALVEALAQTELAVEAAVTVRDRVVEAYQEILRMPV